MSQKDTIKYVRMVADSDGESHYREGEIEVRFASYAPPAAPWAVSEVMPATGAVINRLPAGWVGEFHPAPRVQWAIILQGEIENTMSDGETRRFGPGAFRLMEDTSGKGHFSRVVSEEDAVVMFVHLAREL